KRRIAHADVIGSGSTVGDAGDHNVVFIDVVGALDRVRDRVEVKNLIVAPPWRGIPGIRDDIDLFGALQWRFAGSARLIGFASADAPVKLKPNLIALRGIVGSRYVQGVKVFDSVLGFVAQLDDAGWLGGVGAAGFQASIGLVKRHSGFHDVVDVML